ncbi:MAG TPA: hypothetical protein VHA09_05530 [Nitrososphaera sp.]|nr:hypothetical protein [Nitrososphaera sp.]
MQRTADFYHNSGKKEYDRLLAEAVKLGKQHETRAKYYIPKMYDVLVNKEGMTPFEAADSIYRDVAGIWQKDTIRRLLPPEAKDQAARERQVLSRLHMASAAAETTTSSDVGLTPRKEEELCQAAAVDGEDQPNYEGDSGYEIVVRLKKENDSLRKELEELENVKRALIKKTLKLELSLTEQQLKYEKKQGAGGQQPLRSATVSKQEDEMVTTILIPPKLFMKAYVLMRGSSKPLLLRVKAGEAVDIDKTSLPN